jgi:hypothetical protein
VIKLAALATKEPSRRFLTIYTNLKQLYVARVSGFKYAKLLFKGLLVVKQESPETGGETWLYPYLAV